MEVFCLVLLPLALLYYHFTRALLEFLICVEKETRSSKSQEHDQARSE